MGDYDNTNSGAIFLNDRKDKPSQPDRKGTCTIECPECGVKREFWMSGWIKKAKTDGKQFMSMAFTAKDSDGGHAAQSTGNQDYDDDIPF